MEFTENFEQKIVFVSAHISHDTDSERRTVFFTHFPKYRYCEVRSRTKMQGLLAKAHWRNQHITVFTEEGEARRRRNDGVGSTHDEDQGGCSTREFVVCILLSVFSCMGSFLFGCSMAEVEGEVKSCGPRRARASPPRVLTSSWSHCFDTVIPLAIRKKSGRDHEFRP